jgi:hypothetical protein
MFVSVENVAAGKILVMPILAYQDSVAPEIIKEMSEAILSEFKASSDVFALEGAFVATKRRGARSPLRDKSDIKRAIKTFAAAQKDAKRLRHQDAIPKLEKAISSFRLNLRDFEHYDKLIDAYLLVAECYFRRGKQNAGFDALVHVARLRPKMILQSDRYPPMFTSAFERAKRQVAGRARGAVEIQGHAGLKVLINGKNVGTVPLRVENLVAGEHHVQIVDGEGVFGGSTIKIQGGGVAKKRFTKRSQRQKKGGRKEPSQLSQQIKNNRFGAETRSMALDLGRQKEAEYIWLAVMAPAKSVFEIGSVLGRVSDNRWIRLQNLSPDVDLLSSGIEANNLVMEITEKLNAMREPLAKNTTLPLLKGRPVEGEDSAEIAVARYADAEFGPTPQATSSRRAVPKVAPGSAARRPVGGSARRGIVPRKGLSETKSTDLELSDVTVGTFESTQRPPPRPGRVVRDDGSLEINVPEKKSAEGISLPSSTLQNRAEDDRRGPVMNYSDTKLGLAPKSKEIKAYDAGGMAPIDLDMQIDGYSSASVFTSWWFWSAMTASAAIIGGGTWYMMSSGREPDGVRIQANW